MKYVLINDITLKVIGTFETKQDALDAWWDGDILNTTVITVK